MSKGTAPGQLTLPVAQGPDALRRMARELRRMAEEMERLADGAGGKARQAKVQTQDERAVALELFEFWRTECQHPGAKPTAERIAKVRARLREGYTADEIRAAIRGVATSEYHQGANDGGRKYDDLTLICRSGSQLEQYAEMGGGVVGAPVYSAPDAVAAAIRKQAAEAMEAGDTAAYNRLNEQLEARRRQCQAQE